MKSLRFLAATWLFCALFAVGTQSASAFSLSDELSKLQQTLQSIQGIFSSAVSSENQVGQVIGSTSITGSTATTAPSLTLTVTPNPVTLGNRAVIKWTASNVTTCTASGAWTGTKLRSGTVSTGIFAVAGNRNYTLTCTGVNGTIARTVTLSVTASSTPGTSVSCPVYQIPICPSGQVVVPGGIGSNGCQLAPRCEAATSTSTVSCPNYQIPRCETGQVVVPGGIGSNGCQLAPRCEAATSTPNTSVTVPALNFTVAVRGHTATTSFSLSNGCLGYEIDWGDGKKDSYFGGNGPMCTLAVTAVKKAHTYNERGTYTVKVTPYFGTTAGTAQSKTVYIIAYDTVVTPGAGSCLSGTQSYQEGATLQSIINPDGTRRTIADASFVCRSGQWVVEGSLPNAGTRVVTTSNVNVRVSANGLTLGTQPAGRLGTRSTAAPITAGGYSWVYVNFDTNPDGYVASQYLSTNIPSTTPTVGGMTREQITARLQELQAEIARLQAMLLQL